MPFSYSIIPSLTEKELKTFWVSTAIWWPRACWLWKGRANSDGYGQMKIVRNECTLYLMAHRISYFMHYKIQPVSLLICHTCDTPACVNPSHLFAGTHKQNIEDAVRKGRMASGNRSGTHTKPETLRRGEDHLKSKLTSAQVLEVRSLAASGIPGRVIARRYSLSHTAVQYILKRRSWTHI